MNSKWQFLYDKYHPQLFQYLYYIVGNREICENLVQDVYVRALNSYSTFEGKSSERTWLYSIAKEVGLEWIRNERKKKNWWRLSGKSTNKLEFLVFDQTMFPDEVLVQKEELKRIYQCLLKCSEEEQQVVILRFVQGLNLMETKEVLDWSLRKVKTVELHAIKKIHDQLEKLSRMNGEVVGQ